MAAASQRAPPRKRNRKRKRRNFSSSESSSESEDSSSSGRSNAPAKPKKTLAKPTPELVVEESSSSSSSSDSDADGAIATVAPIVGQAASALPTSRDSRSQPKYDSPPPPSAALPSFVPPKGAASEQENEKEIAFKVKFRKFWMASVADSFVEDLIEIRKEPSLTTSRLELLIDSLATGADVYTSSRGASRNDVNEMEVVLEGH